MILFKGINFKHIQGIALWPFVLLKPNNPSQDLINHERIHLRQQLEMGVIFFYVWYSLEWLYKLLKLRNRQAAYLAISFEKEAYTNDCNHNYLKNRRFWQFLKYI
ncbi:MAG: hypothetical protein ACRCVT_08140 [Leadbetterella sp.]